jgi:aminoglycoside phosphotransferase family enzyme/predicted kinase
MELPLLIEALSVPSAYPFAATDVEVRQTHISVVFLADRSVYKIKKPLALDFLDFSTLEKRRHFCDEEVRLNRRLAPQVYLGVVPIVRRNGGVVLEGDGEVVEWAVKMQRLPEEATLLARLRRGEVDRERIAALAGRIAAFHRQATSGAAIRAQGRLAVVARNVRENLEQARAQVGLALRQTVFDRLRSLTESALSRFGPLIEERARRDMPRDTHGDLRLDHIYLFPEQAPPKDLVIIDCIEFNERFRFADPVADMAFVAMDLAFRGRRDLAAAFSAAYFRAAADDEGAALLPFYRAYRAAVRAKVEGLEQTEHEIPRTEREAALGQARAHWLLALGELETPVRKPCLVLVGGLPGSGKSTLALGLAARADFTVIRSDIVRKDLAGSNSGEELYSTEQTRQTYAECLRRAEELLQDGRRVLVDATFREDAWRRAFLKAAVRWGMPGLFLLCRASPAVVQARLAARRGDVSDADWAVYQQLAAAWEDTGPLVRQTLRAINTDGSQEDALNQALGLLRQADLYSGAAGPRV